MSWLNVSAEVIDVPLAFDTHIITARIRKVKHFVEKNQKIFFCEFIANEKKIRSEIPSKIIRTHKFPRCAGVTGALRGRYGGDARAAVARKSGSLRIL